MGLFSTLNDQEKLCAHIDNRAETMRLEMRLREYFRYTQPKNILVLCIGTDRSTGDSLGPMTGTCLHRLHLPNLTILGTLDQPVHAVNLHENIQKISDDYSQSFILSVDACLGRLSSIGQITLGEGPLKPGAGVHKDLPSIGDIHLTGVVNVSGFMEHLVLQNTRLSLVWRMAETLAFIIARAYSKKEVLP